MRSYRKLFVSVNLYFHSSDSRILKTDSFQMAAHSEVYKALRVSWLILIVQPDKRDVNFLII